MDEREELAALRRLAELEAKASGQPMSVEAGGAINSIPRQVGLAARYGIEGLANTAQLVTEPLRAVTDMFVPERHQTLSGLVTGAAKPPKSKPLGVVATELADWVGLPSPQTANERVIGDASRMVAGAGGFGGAVQAATKAIPKAATYVAEQASPVLTKAADFLNASRSLPQGLTGNMPQQLASAGGAGLFGGMSREAGGSPLMQGGAALVGGVLGGFAPGAASGVAGAAKNVANSFRPGAQQLIQQRIDQTINVTLQQQGIDPATITPAMRAAMREQLGKAMKMGDLNPEAVARLADYTRLNMQPTRARLTLDPFDVTQEQNASRLAAATGERSAKLPQIAQDNNQRLITLMDDMGGARPVDPYGQGSAAIGAINARDAALKGNVDALYGRAREMAGGDIPIDRKPFVDNIFSELAKSGKLSFAPETIMGRLNQISGGVVRANGQEFDVPFTAQTIDELKTMVATAQRSTNDGNVKGALNAIRKALDGTTVNPVKASFGGGQVVTGDGAQFLRTRDGQPAQFMDALNEARAAAASRFNWRESAAPIDDALHGATADTFIKNRIISRASGFDDVAKTAATINASPEAREAVRLGIVQHLKDASIGKGGTSATGNFSGRAMESALKDIGDRKLGLFFEPDEIETLRAMARTGAFETFQPRGSAVNNSNTAAGVGSLLQSLSKYVKPVANKFPLGEPIVSKPLDSITASVLMRPTMDIPKGLLAQYPRPQPRTSLLLPAAAYGGLLAAP